MGIYREHIAPQGIEKHTTRYFHSNTGERKKNSLDLHI